MFEIHGLNLVLDANLIMSLISYLIMGAGLYTLAKRREQEKPWLAWVPIGNIWLLGDIVDEIKRQLDHKQTRYSSLLPSPSIIFLSLPLADWLIGIVFGQAFVQKFSYNAFLAACFSFALIYSIVVAVYYYIALSRLFLDYAPSMRGLYTVLSILFPTLVPSVLIFIIRNNESESYNDMADAE